MAAVVADAIDLVTDFTAAEGDWIDLRGIDAERDELRAGFHEPPLAPDERCATMAFVALVLTFLLGLANFAVHKAVLESGHPLLGQMPWFVHMLGGRLTLITEFIVLLAALLLAANGWSGLAWAYLAYSALNAIAAWLILTDRI